MFCNKSYIYVHLLEIFYKLIRHNSFDRGFKKDVASAQTRKGNDHIIKFTVERGLRNIESLFYNISLIRSYINN